MMRWGRHTCACVCALVLAAAGGGVTKEAASGIEQFWTDDYKVFDQIYGKTSDKEIYGASLPAPTAGFTLDSSRLRNSASEKKEHFVEQQQIDPEADTYGYGNRYAGLLTQPKKPAKKPYKPTKFVPSDFKPIISKETDPETYNYLRHLEQLQNKEQYGAIANPGNLGNFKPFLKYPADSSEETDGYKSIQDILDAHEANKGKNPENDNADGQVKYLTYGGPKNRNRKKVQPATVVSKGKYRCPSARCRKRTTTTYRGRTYLTRPIIRKIKKIYSY